MCRILPGQGSAGLAQELHGQGSWHGGVLTLVF